jgi:hypothetical protein
LNADPDPATQINADAKPCTELNKVPVFFPVNYEQVCVGQGRSFHLLFDMGDSGGLHVAVRTRRLPLHELILCNELTMLQDGRKFGQITKPVTEKKVKDRTFYAPIKSQKSGYRNLKCTVSTSTILN